MKIAAKVEIRIVKFLIFLKTPSKTFPCFLAKRGIKEIDKKLMIAVEALGYAKLNAINYKGLYGSGVFKKIKQALEKISRQGE